MMHKAWSGIVEVLYRFSRSYVKFQGHMALKIVEFDPNWAFPDCNYSLNSPMATKCCTKLKTAKERCPIVFQGHPSNFKVTRYKTSPILTQIGHFRTIGRSQLSNPSDLPCLMEYEKSSIQIRRDRFYIHVYGIHILTPQISVGMERLNQYWSVLQSWEAWWSCSLHFTPAFCWEAGEFCPCHISQVQGYQVCVQPPAPPQWIPEGRSYSRHAAPCRPAFCQWSAGWRPAGIHAAY